MRLLHLLLKQIPLSLVLPVKWPSLKRPSVIIDTARSLPCVKFRKEIKSKGFSKANLGRLFSRCHNFQDVRIDCRGFDEVPENSHVPSHCLQ